MAEVLKAKIDLEVAQAIRALKEYQTQLRKAGDDTDTTTQDTKGFDLSLKNIAKTLIPGGSVIGGLALMSKTLGEIRDRQKEIIQNNAEMARNAATFANNLNVSADLFGIPRAEAGRRVMQGSVATGLPPQDIDTIRNNLQNVGAFNEANFELATQIALQALRPGDAAAAADVILIAQEQLGLTSPSDVRGFANQVFKAAKASRVPTGEFTRQFSKLIPLGKPAGLSVEQLLQIEQRAQVVSATPRLGGQSAIDIVTSTFNDNPKIRSLLRKQGIDPKDATVPQIMDTVTSALAEVQGRPILQGKLATELGLTQIGFLGAAKFGPAADIFAGEITTDPVIAPLAQRRAAEDVVINQRARFKADLAQFERGISFLPAETLLQEGFATAINARLDQDLRVGQNILSGVPFLGTFAGTDQSKAGLGLAGAFSKLYNQARSLTARFGADPRLKRLWELIPHFDPLSKAGIGRFEFWLGTTTERAGGLEEAAQLLKDIINNPPEDFTEIPAPGPGLEFQGGIGAFGGGFELTPGAGPSRFPGAGDPNLPSVFSPTGGPLGSNFFQTPGATVIQNIGVQIVDPNNFATGQPPAATSEGGR